MKHYTARFLALLAVVAASACATKRDVDRIRSDLAWVRARQDSIATSLLELDSALAAAQEEQRSLALTMGGDIRRQLDDMERQLVQIQELLGQSQIVLGSLRERIEMRELQEPRPGIEPDSATIEGGGAEGGAESDARALYAAAMEQFRRGAYNTARSGFEEFLDAFPADELAPDAQYHLAETYREEGDASRALAAYNRVVQLYPNSQAAPTALYKAALLQFEQGNKDSACQYFQRVMAGYPRSDEARLARDQAQRHGCR
jgi:tol-pal system protein YbgF